MKRGAHARRNADEERHDGGRNHERERGVERVEEDVPHGLARHVARAHVERDELLEVDEELLPERQVEPPLGAEGLERHLVGGVAEHDAGPGSPVM